MPLMSVGCFPEKAIVPFPGLPRHGFWVRPKNPDDFLFLGVRLFNKTYLFLGWARQKGEDGPGWRKEIVFSAVSPPGYLRWEFLGRVSPRQPIISKKRLRLKKDCKKKKIR